VIFATNRAVRVFAFPEPTDLRKGYNGLFGLVKNGLGRDPLSGDLYLFVNRHRTTCKVLAWDGTGLCIFQKRLERGRFAALWRDYGETLRLTPSELSLFIEGCALVGRHTLSPKEIVPTPLASDRAV
jgi:transposase